MLQIRLNKGSVDAVIGAKPVPGESVTVACPDHLVLADLPVAKGLGSATSASIVKVVGRKSRRQLTERVHFCARCDYPIAIYGRLSPCEHAFCLDCARSDSICYLCDERIQKIQTIKMMEGILICAAPDCLKSFLKKVEFESHIHNSHANLLQLNMKQENKNESETSGAKQSLTLDTALRGPPRPSPPPSNFQLNDDKGHRLQPPLRPLTQPKPPSQYHGQVNPSEGQPDWHMGMDGSTQTRIQQLNTDSQGVMQQEFSQIPLKQQQGLLPDRHHDQSSLYPQQPPNFPMPVNGNPMMFAPRPFGFPPIQSDGGFPIFGALAPYEPARSEQTQEERLEQGPVLGFTPGPGRPSFMEGYPHPWNGGPNVSFEASQAGQGLLAAQQGMPPPPPPPGPPPPHLLHHMSTDRQSNGWPLERRDSFRGSQD